MAKTSPSLCSEVLGGGGDGFSSSSLWLFLMSDLIPGSQARETHWREKPLLWDGIPANHPFGPQGTCSNGSALDSLWPLGSPPAVQASWARPEHHVTAETCGYLYVCSVASARGLQGGEKTCWDWGCKHTSAHKKKIMPFPGWPCKYWNTHCNRCHSY